MKTSADSFHAQEKEHDFLLDALGGPHFDAKSDRLLGGAEYCRECLLSTKEDVQSLLI